MKTFFSVKFALLPFAVFFTLVAYGFTGAAIGAGFAVGLLVCLWRIHTREIKSLEIAALVILTAIGAGYLIRPEFVGERTIPFVFVGLGAFAIASVATGKPWTAEFSRVAYPGAESNPVFISVNMILSALWGVLFLLLAGAHALQAGSVVTTAIVVVGAIASMLAPEHLVRRGLARRLAARETYRWPAPALAGVQNGADVDVAVVGAGIGGLTAAALLADAGLKVLVAEQHFQPGGFCQSFQRKLMHDGKPCVYRFDAGPHDFSGAWRGGPIASVLERLGVAGRIEWKPINHTYRTSDLAVDIPRDWREYVAELARLFPASAGGFEPLFNAIREIHDAMYSSLISQGGIPGLGMTVDTMRVFLRQYPLAVAWLDKPFDDLVARFITDARARSFLATLKGYVSDGSEPLTCAQMVPLFGYYFHGSHYPVGGSRQFASALVAAIRERGGEVRLNSPVKRIAVDAGRAAGIVLADGTRISAGAVVANADLKRTFLELLDPADVPKDFRARIAAAEPANSAFAVHLGVDFVPDVRPAIHAKYDQELGITAMSLIDPSAAPPGHAAITLLRLIPYHEAQTWFPTEGDANADDRRPSFDYPDRKKQLGDMLIAVAENIIPGLSQHIVYRDEASPLTFARYDWSTTGAIYGQKARLKGAKSPVPALAVAGSTTHGAGVEAAVISGAYAANALLPGLLTKPPSG